ncbi:cell division protein FtsQ/DivIB [Evansella cellulosilytica]|uniref:Cell division protein DivIB n=1 Tax=Evansella cellulosilytica (strain ATCC 21833 / DSM 2522 / FERM P-1141 / JCM 9156 / N-4) TaxID=649639 RepID=E6TTS8_EVAC2|nr:FtsQ-type POTRA domain-containing protein [Evansella cellulosilytica]ADU30847.1 cell division protein FtsQ [Evansella cellulosilytica DSM 2522]
MSKKNVIEIEERIPTLKDRRKQRANRRVIFYISLFFLLMTIVAYFQTSYSHVKSVNVVGNENVSEEWIIQQSRLLEEVSMWRINAQSVEETILERPEIAKVELNREWPNSIAIAVEEYNRVGYVAYDGLYYPLLETGQVLNNDGTQNPIDGPILTGMNSEEHTMELAEELVNISQSLRLRISEILLSPTEQDPLRLIIYMNDGFEVHSTIRRFAERISPYPSVVEQLDPNVEGIVHMRVNPYFERFDMEEEEEVESEG